ncbi:hypothetical protein IWQ57_006144 [Coemansia nantahalensis]|uniref:Uncharacterized protein n=1 Tax=Coemansia nantahalensis TaxID=2789366 RepID=A0ACC1JL26_9FUNG|nr:hypothetical protein IWQ57_006144 [Coemansia nantahalensis]
MKAYPPAAPAAEAGSSGRYSSIDLLASPVAPASPGACSETTSMREFYSSAARLEQLLNSSRMSSVHHAQPRAENAGITLGRTSSSTSTSSSGSFELVSSHDDHKPDGAI